MQRTFKEMDPQLTLKHKISLDAGVGAPLALLVHGRAGDVNVMSTFYRTVPTSHNIITVQAPHSDPIGGYSWWMVDETGFNWELAHQAAEALGSFLEEALSAYRLEPQFLYALGFSQGSAILSILMQKNPDRFLGLAILAGFVIEIDDVQTAGKRLPSVFWAHGSKDSIVRPERASRGVKYLESLGCQVEYVEDEVTHKVGRLGMKRLKDWQLEL